MTEVEITGRIDLWGIGLDVVDGHATARTWLAEDVVAWCAENLVGKFEYGYRLASTRDHNIEYIEFEYDRDAVAFKLRWF